MKWLNENWKEISINFLIMLVIFSMGFYLSYFLNKNEYKKIESLLEEKDKYLEKLNLAKEREGFEKKERKKIFLNFDNLNFKGEAILIREFNGKEIYSKNKNTLFPIASITKIINAIIALENHREERVFLSPRALRVEGKYGIRTWEVFNQKDAIKYMLIGSVNDIASAISFGPKDYGKNWYIFIRQMNNFARKNDLNNTLFFSENGLNINSHIMGAYSTADDISKVTKYFYDKYPEVSKDTILKECNICSDKKCHYVRNTNIILEKYPEIIFSKTGYTDLAGGSLTVVLKIKNKKYIVVILKSGKQGRFDDLEKIILELRKNA